MEAGAHPVVESVGHARLLAVRALVAKQSGPLIGEVVGVVTRGQQTIDEAVAFVSVLIG